MLGSKKCTQNQRDLTPHIFRIIFCKIERKINRKTPKIGIILERRIVKDTGYC
jgi:hypothetical protein